MKQDVVRVLILEDNPADATLVERALASGGLDSEVSRAVSEDDFKAALNSGVDIVLADHNLPSFSSTDALNLLLEHDPEIPFIVVSGTIPEELAVDLLRRGAADYVLKDRMARLVPAVRSALRERDLRRKKKEMSLAWSESKALQESVLSSLHAHLAVLDADGEIIVVNSAWTNFARANGDRNGKTTGIGVNYIEVCRAAAESDPAVQEVLDGILRVLHGEESSYKCEYACHSPTRMRWYQMHVTPLEGHDGGIVISHQNVTDRRYAEETVRDTESLFSTVVNNSSDGIVVLSSLRDEQGRIDDFEIVRANPGAAKFTGETPERLVGMRLCRLFPKLKASGIFDRYKAVVESGEADEWESFFESDEFGGWFALRAVKIWDGLAITFRDVSKQMEREEALREAKERFERLGQTIPGVIYTFAIDPDGKYRLPYLSKGGAALFGVDVKSYAKDASGLLDLIHLDDRENFISGVQASADTLGSWRWEGRVVFEDGEKWISAASEPRRRADGGVEWDGLAMDITPRIEAEAALKQSQRHQAALFEQSLDAVLIADDNGRYVDANPAACVLLQRSREELCEMSVWDLTPGTGMERGKAAWAVFIEDGTLSGEYRIHRPDGTTVDAEFRAVANILEGRHLSVLRDITERKQAQANRNRLAAIVESSSDAIMSSTIEGAIMDWNAGAEKIFGYSADEIRGRSFNILIPEEARFEAEHITESLRQGNGCRNWEVIRRRKDGSLVEVSLSASPIIDDSGKSIGGSAIMRDISAQKEFIRETLTAKQKAEEMTRLKSSFLANMSHEIRTPLTGIIGFADILADQLPEDQRELAEFIANSGERLMETLTSVLDLAQLESGNMKLKLEPIDVVRQTRQTLDVLIPQAKARGIYLNLDVREVGPVHARSDAAALNRILSNVCANAVKFTNDGGVDVRVAYEGDTVVIEIQDTGVGIDPDFLPFIFDEYKQESDGCTRDFEGSGLGLTISSRLADLMQATLTVESVKGQGSTFRLALPREMSHHESGLSAKENVPRDSSHRRPQILLVEDNIVMHQMVRVMIADCCDVDCVADGESALVLASDTRYDAVLLDIDLGRGIGGEDVLRELRMQPEYRNVPVIAATAYALDGDEERFLLGGFDAYISKPFRKSDLRRVLDGALSAALPQ